MSFYSETALFRNLGVNLRICLCGVWHYTSVQMLDFLDLAKIFWFPDQKRYSSPPEFPDDNQFGIVSQNITIIGG